MDITTLCCFYNYCNINCSSYSDIGIDIDSDIGIYVKRRERYTSRSSIVMLPIFISLKSADIKIVR